MARKEKQQKNGLDQRPPNRKKEASDHATSPLATKDRGNVNDEETGLGKELPNGTHSTHFTKSADDVDQAQDRKNTKKKFRKSQSKDRKGTDEKVAGHAVLSSDNTEVDKSGTSTAEASNVGDGSDLPRNDFDNINDIDNSLSTLHSEEGLGSVEYPETAVFKFIRTAALSVARSSADWVERHKPTFTALKSDILKGRDLIRMKIQLAQPIVFRWMRHIGNIMLLLFMVWLDCTVRGLDSLLRMGTTSFFLILWCSFLSVIAMVGIGKVLLTLGIVAAVGLFLGFTLAIVLTGLTGIIFLWFYGSFWTTGLVIFIGGLAFLTSHDRIALFITSVYSIYCAWNYVGWFGLVLGLNLSFISSDALLFFLRNVINEQGIPHGNPEQSSGFQGQPSFHPNESVHAQPTDNGSGGARADRSPGVPSTSGSDSEMTSEDEVVRLLNCTDHYAALGLTRFENIDLAIIKREYRKKAMLVHPDKNMGDEKAAEAFKKLQNAYEVLLDSFKRKEYDDELRREELLNYFRKFQNTSHQNKGPKSRFTRQENGEDPLGESRHIACRKCGLFHLWVYTKKIKSKARWCQECKDFHQAKDGDGWVEQSSQPFFFGMLQQVEAPSAYVCAGGKVYDATEWYICQGMRCHVNTHKPSFHVNTSVVSKNTQAKGMGSGQRGGMPTPNMEETMTEEEFFEWLQSAMQSGMFENFGSSTSESPSGANPKSGNGSSSNGSSASSKKKKKGKKPW